MLAYLLLSGLPALWADNPIVTNIYTADPAPIVYNNRFYIFCGHDEGGTSGGWIMREWRVLSSADMVNWTDHGAVLRVSDISWLNTDQAWASQCVERNGRFYFYICDSGEIGVAVSDNILGPWTYRGTLNGPAGVGTNHPGIAEYMGQWYFVYHTDYLSGGVAWQRSVSIDYLYYNSDGTMQQIIQTTEGVDPVTTDPTPATFDFPDTGAWTTWSSASATINLNSGTNTIRLTATGSEGGPNLDRMDITVESGTVTPEPTDPPQGTRGDVNGDGSIDIVDALLTAQYYVGLNPQNFDINNADTNCDGGVDIVDALLIAQFYVGLITGFC